VLKKIIKAILLSIIKIFSRSRFGNYVSRNFISNAMSNRIKISHNHINFVITKPNTLCEWRAKTFSSKEPETLSWIDSFVKDSIFWDIGANIGLYSIYSNKKNNCKVWAFEPSVFNIEILARNIFINDLSESITIIPIPLNDKISTSTLNMTSLEWGGALSTFGNNFGWDGKKINEAFKFKTVGISMDNMHELLNIPLPNYIKIDVDGLEHFILKGGKRILKYVDEVLIEINDDFDQQSKQSFKLLSNAGLNLKHKLHSEYIENNTHGFQNTYNQIWTRK